MSTLLAFAVGVALGVSCYKIGQLGERRRVSAALAHGAKAIAEDNQLVACVLIGIAASIEEGRL